MPVLYAIGVALCVSVTSSVTSSAQAASTNGTSAQLRTGDVITVRDLLYALMLPSGNDAAVVSDP